jgi:hypothetical protein
MVKQMIRHLFVVTSAINSRFGVYKPDQRLEQTIETINSIRARVPDAGIVIMECTGVSPTEEQENTLRENCDYYLDYTRDPTVQALYASTDNWDIVKNGTEIMCFGRALELLEKNNVVADYDRIYKMSGRYVLNETFNADMYGYDLMRDQIIIGHSYPSQFPYHVTLVQRQYMARLWSWPVALHSEIVQVYKDSFDYFKERVDNGGYVDIEHVLYKFLDRKHLAEVEELGVEGTIAPNGVSIRN